MKQKTIFFSTFLLAIVYGSFLAVDIHSGFSDNLYSKSVRYLSLLLCLTLVFVAKEDANSPKDFTLIRLAFFFTACADFTLSIVCRYSFTTFSGCHTFERYKFGVGVLFFFIVQLIYIIRHKKNFKWNKKEIITPLVIFGAMALQIIQQSQSIKEGGSSAGVAVIVVIGVYILTLCVSLWMAIGTLWRGHFPRQTAWFIALGMLLFFLCDNSLGRFIAYPRTVPLAEAESFIVADNSVVSADIVYGKDERERETISVYTDPAKMRVTEIPFTPKTIFGILVWFFYLPAQVLLALSAYKSKYLSSIFGLIK